MGLAMAHHATQESERVFVEQAKVGAVILRLNSAFPGAVDAYAKLSSADWIKLIDLDVSWQNHLGSSVAWTPMPLGRTATYAVSAVTAASLKRDPFSHGVSASCYSEEDIVAVTVGANAPDNTYLRGVSLARQYGVPLLTSL